MKNDDKEIIKSIIVPLISRGEASLLLGAGFSIVNNTEHGRLPDGNGLRDLILHKCNKKAGIRTSLKDAYLLGEREIKNFKEFLASCFIVKSVYSWQERIFYYAWNRIYTTNIDNVLNLSYKQAQAKNKAGGEYLFFNYLDPNLTSKTIGNIPVISIHGTCLKLDDGFIFSTLEYAKATTKVLDWHHDLAAKIMTGGLIVIGNQLEETDIDAYTAARELLYQKESNAVNWIVIPDPDEIKAENYRSAGYHVIDATAEEFFNVIFESISPKNIGEIFLENVPSVKKAASGVKAMTWFKEAFQATIISIENAAQKRGILRHFITGAEPEWFFIVNDAHATISKHIELTNLIGQLMQSNTFGIGILHVTGPSGSGKTTTVRASTLRLIKTYKYIYEFDGNSGIEPGLLKDIIERFTEKSVFIFYKAAEYYYAINYLHEHFRDKRIPYCLFVLEDRSNEHRKSKRQITDYSNSSFFELGDLSFDDAKRIAEKIEERGLQFEKFSELSLEQRARKILDKERGFGGDLLSALFSLTTHENFEQKIYQEYHSVNNSLAKKILELVSITHSLGFQIPIAYVAGFLSEKIDVIAKCIHEELAGIIINYSGTSVLRCRHRVIADYYFKSCISRRGDSSLLIDILEFLSRQFDVNDIKYHPLAYKIYKEIISFEFMYDKYFPFSSRRDDTEKTYHESQRFFGKDGVFWLHFGRFYKKIGKLDLAIDCFRVGLELYDSFQTRHSLGATLLEKYISEQCQEDELYVEGAGILEQERLTRGVNDAYPTATLLDFMLKIIDKNPQNTDALEKAKDCVNIGMKYFKHDDYIGCLIKTYVSIKKE